MIEERKVRERQLYFGLAVGLLVACKGGLVLTLGEIGWSLIAVGAAVAVVAVISYRAEQSQAKEQPIEASYGLTGATE